MRKVSRIGYNLATNWILPEAAKKRLVGGSFQDRSTNGTYVNLRCEIAKVSELFYV